MFTSFASQNVDPNMKANPCSWNTVEACLKPPERWWSTIAMGGDQDHIKIYHEYYEDCYAAL